MGRTEDGEGRRIRVVKDPEERKREIVETALSLFSEKGFEGTSIQDIADAMGVSQGLCYRYFRSKGEIFAAASDLYAREAVEHIGLPMPEGLSATDKLNLVVKRIFEYTIRHHEFESNYRRDAEVRASRVDDVAENMVAVLVPVLEQGLREGDFSFSGVEPTTRLLTYGVIHTIHSNMPEDDARGYLISYLGYLREVLARVLGARDPSAIGRGWDDLR